MRRIVSIWIVSMAFGAVPAAVLAQVQSLCTVPAPGDADLDGFSNAQECETLMLTGGLQLAGSSSVAPCAGGESAADRALCLHPSGRDLFWIDQNPSLQLPADTFVALGRDLGITFHRLLRTAGGIDRDVSTASTQKALQILTDPNSASGVLGRANWGTPNNLDGTTIYPNRVANYVNGLCSAAGITVCQTSTGVMGAANIIPVLTRWVADHEVGHTLALSRIFNSSFGGYHEASGSLTVMEQSPKVVSKRGTVTFFVANVFSLASATDAKLAGTQ